MASGGVSIHLREQPLSTINVPPMNASMSSCLENQIGEWWKEVLRKEIAKAGT
jgi:hypothetical protein